MSFARHRFIVGLQPRISLAPRSSSARSAILAHRLLSTSAVLRARYTHPPNNYDDLKSDLSEHLNHHAPPPEPIYDAQGHELNPYQNGPSAIDKAVHLFFFTEIIRGRHLNLQMSRIQLNFQ